MRAGPSDFAPAPGRPQRRWRPIVFTAVVMCAVAFWLTASSSPDGRVTALAAELPADTLVYGVIDTSNRLFGALDATEVGDLLSPLLGLEALPEGLGSLGIDGAAPVALALLQLDPLVWTVSVGITGPDAARAGVAQVRRAMGSAPREDETSEGGTEVLPLSPHASVILLDGRMMWVMTEALSDPAGAQANPTPTLKGVQERLLTQQAEERLSANPDFAASMAPPFGALAVFVNLPQLRRAVAADTLEGEAARRLMRSMRGLTVTLQARDRDLTVATRLVLEADHGLAVLRSERQAANLLARMPGPAVAAGQLALDAGVVYTLTDRMSRHLTEGDVSLDTWRTEIADEVGVDLREDVLDQLNGQVAFTWQQDDLNSAGGMDWIVALGVRSEEKIGQVLHRLFRELAEDLDLERHRTEDRIFYTLSEWDNPPAVAVYEGALIVTRDAARMRAILSGDAAPLEDGDQATRFESALDTDEPAVAFVDLAALNEALGEPWQTRLPEPFASLMTTLDEVTWVGEPMPEGLRSQFQARWRGETALVQRWTDGLRELGSAHREETRAYRGALTANYLEQIHGALRRHHNEVGSYPKRLDLLVDRGWLPAASLVDPWGQRWVYEPPTSTPPSPLSLCSRGPDGAAPTDDDICLP